MTGTNRRGPWQKTSSREVFDNEYFRVHEDQVIRPDGKPGTYYVVEFHHSGIGIVALTDDQHVFLVRQYRYPIGLYSWEIPAGSDRPGEEFEDCARRELKEEVGIEAASWSYLGRANTEVSNTNAVFHSYLAQGLTQKAPQREGTEDLEVKTVPLEEALRMIDSGEVFSANTIVALHLASRRLSASAPSIAEVQTNRNERDQVL